MYCDDVPGSEALRAQLGEAHWAYMDDFDAAMTARGPTFDDDGRTVTGSLHIVDLPSYLDAETFAQAEPNHLAGVYAGVRIWPWRNELGRRMWDYPPERHDGAHHLVIARGRTDVAPTGAGLGAAHDAFLRRYADQLIVYGSLLSEESAAWAGTLFAVGGGDRAAVDDLLAGHPYVGEGLYERRQVHAWRFGGRR